MQTALPIILCSLTCLVLIISHFIPHEANTVVFSQIKGTWYAIIKVAGYAIATLAVLRSHIRRLQARTTDWQYSAVALVCFSSSTLFTALLEPLYFKRKTNGKRPLGEGWGRQIIN